MERGLAKHHVGPERAAATTLRSVFPRTPEGAAEPGRDGVGEPGPASESMNLKRQGDALARQSRFAEAEVLYRRALALAPDLAEAHNNLGNVLSLQGRGEEAAACYRRALEHKPTLLDAHNNLGVWLAGQGLTEAAAGHLRQVVRQNPAHGEAHLNLAKLLVKMSDRAGAAEHFRLAAESPHASAELRRESAVGLIACREASAAQAILTENVERDPLDSLSQRALSMVLAERQLLEESLFHARQALEIEPRDGLVHAELALLLKAQGRMADARFHARTGVELSAGEARAHLILGSILESEGQIEEALKSYAEAVRLAPDMAEAHSAYGILLSSTDNLARALQSLRRAVELAPENPSVHNNLGIGLQENNQYDDARASFERALAIDPGLAQTYCNLAMLELQLGHVGEAERLYRRAFELKPDLPPAILGLVQVSSNRRNAISVGTVESMLSQTRLDRNAKLELHFALAKAFDDSGEFERAFAHAGRAHALRLYGDNPEPVADMARRTIDVFSAEFFADRPGYGRRSELPVLVVGLPRSGTTLVEQILSSHPRIFGAGELMDLVRLSNQLGSFARISEPYPMGARQLDEASALRLAATYLQSLKRLGGNAERVIDKLPFNFWRLGLVALMLPRARIINCRRHPLDIFISGYFMRFRHPIRHVGDQGLFAEYYSAYAQLMDHWRKVLPNPILDVDYEDLVTRQEEVSRSMVEFCGLPWDPACLEFYNNPRPVRTGSVTQVRRSIYAGSVGRWRSYAAQLQPLIAALISGGELPAQEEALIRAAAG